MLPHLFRRRSLARRRYSLINKAASASAETNDLSSVVTWANVPDANITESSVTQHQAALAIAASQITSLTSTVAELNLLDLSGLTAGWVLAADTASTASWQAPAAGGGGDAVLADDEPVVGHWTFTNASGIDIYDAGGTDFGNLSHDGTDFNFAFTNAVDVNFTGAGAAYTFDLDVQLKGAAELWLYGPVDTDYMYLRDTGSYGQIATNTNDIRIYPGGVYMFEVDQTGASTPGTFDAVGAITAASYGGITEANLVDKSAAEVVTGEWSVISVARNKTTDYTMVLGDAGQTVRTTGSTAAQTITIPANGSVAYAIGTMIGIENDSSVSWSLAITTDTLTWSKDNTTGTRTLAAGASAVIHKTTATTWKVSGSALVT